MYMKKFTLNLGVIIISFAIGLAINSACADSLGDSMSNVDNMDLSEIKELVSALQGKVTTLENNLNKANNSISNLTTEVSSLQTKNDALTKRIASLEQNVSSNSGNTEDNSSVCGMFQVDGLWFTPSGTVCSKIKSSQGTQVHTQNGVTTETVALSAKQAEYDTHGRLLKLEYNTPTGYKYYRVTYQYHDMSVTDKLEYATDYVQLQQVVTTTYY